MSLDLIFASISSVFSLIFFIISMTNPARKSTYVGPNGWPNFILGTMFILSIWYLIRTLVRKKIEKKEKESVDEHPKKFSLLSYENRHWILLCVLVVYTIVLPYLGFFLSSVGLFIYVAYSLGTNSIRKTILFSVISMALVVMLFGKVLSISLPRGIGIIETITSFLY